MIARRSLALIGIATVLMAGCATRHEKYAWGTYDRSLYVYYKDPASVVALSGNLEATIKGAETTHAVVAPGLYAEYGYLRLQQGDAKGAVTAFQQEEIRWPESKVFMDHMIKVASSNSASGSARSVP
jgi:hypothetical protein